MTNNDKVEVIQADRDAAAEYLTATATAHPMTIARIRDGEMDSGLSAQAFARHRQSFSRTPDEIVEALEAALCAQTWAECLGHVHEAQAKARGHD
jgi:hypothetical protein